MNHKWEVGNTVQYEYCIYQFYPGSLDPDLNISVSQVKWLDPDLLYMYCIKTRIQYPRKITILPHSFISYYFFREIFFLFLQRHYFCIIFFHNPVFAVLLPSYLFCVTSWYILLILCCYFFFFRDASFLSCDDWLVLTLYFEPVCWYWGPP